MKVETVVGSITVALVLCSSALAANPNQQGLSQAQIDQGCTRNGRYVSCPSQMQRVEAGGIQRVEAGGIQRAEAGGIKRAEAGGIKRAEAGGIKRAEAGGIKRAEAGGIRKVELAHIKKRPHDTQAQADRRGQLIDPKGQGLNQAQINAMEGQRQLMWNATGGGMGYRR